jgi:hypothetical protein
MKGLNLNENPIRRESKRERAGGAEIGSEKKTIPQFVNRGGDSHPVILLFLQQGHLPACFQNISHMVLGIE